MSTTLEVALLVWGSWLVAAGASFYALRWLIIRQHTERADLLDRCMEMIGTIHTYQVAVHQQAPPSVMGRHHYSEEEEDVLARREELTKAELEAALAEAEFMGTEVEIEA